MTNLPLVLLASLPLLIGGCAGSEEDDTGVPADADTDTDADSDTDEVGPTFEIVRPVAGATVYVDDEVVPCDDADLCTYSADADEDNYRITATLAGMFFVSKYMLVYDGVTYQEAPTGTGVVLNERWTTTYLPASTVSWNPGGCPDTTWAGDSWCLSENGADAWVMSEYAMAVDGEYCDQYYPEDCYDVETDQDDLDGDGVDEEVVLETDDGLTVIYNMSGNLMYGFSGVMPYGYGIMESDLSVLYIHLGGEDGDAYYKILVKQEGL